MAAPSTTIAAGHHQEGSDGWADVWKRGYFAFEYKGKHKDLDAAYRQLDDYRTDLEAPVPRQSRAQWMPRSAQGRT